MTDLRPTKRRRYRDSLKPKHGQKRTREEGETSIPLNEAKRHRRQYVVRARGGRGFTVEEDKSKPFPVSIIRFEAIECNVFSQYPLPSSETTCWTVRVLNYHEYGFIKAPLMGVCSNIGHPECTMEAVGWHVNTHLKVTHDNIRLDEPGLKGYNPNVPGIRDERDTNLFHFKFDPKALQLHLRVGCYPNRHFTVPLRAGNKYSVCLLYSTASTAEIQTEAAW